MITLTLSLLSLILSTSAFAATDSETTAELLETLIVNAGQVELEGDIGEQTLAGLLARSLAKETLVGDGQWVSITSVGSQCELEDSSNGNTFYTCTLSIQDGSYEKTSGGYAGPETESSYMFTFKANKPTGKKLQLLGKKVKVDLAG